jgi:hypothetical protein
MKTLANECYDILERMLIYTEARKMNDIDLEDLKLLKSIVIYTEDKNPGIIQLAAKNMTCEDVLSFVEHIRNNMLEQIEEMKNSK